MSSFALAAFAGAVFGLALPVPKSTFEKNTEKCVHAMYADKYNGDNGGNPHDTFVKCMKVQHSRLFKTVEEQYKPSTPSTAS